MLRKVLIALVSLGVLAMDWAALHDILTGEPNVWMEWAFLIASLALAAKVAYRLYRRDAAH